MTASLRDLGRRVDSVTAPQLDVATLVAAGDSRIRRRRLAAVAAATTAVLAVVAAGAVLASPDTRRSAPAPARPDRDDGDSDTVRTGPMTRELTYAVGTTIRWGEVAIDVGEPVHFLDVTDDGVVYVRGPASWKQPRSTGVWFADGAVVVRIGTVEGSPYSGFDVRSSTAGSFVVWQEPGRAGSGDYVVYDTAQMRVRGRVPADAGRAQVLGVLDDAVYFGPRDLGCNEVASFPPCVRDGSVVERYDVATGVLSRTTGEAYDRDRRSRARTIVGPLFGEAGTVLYDKLVFLRRGRQLLADGGEPGEEGQVQLARSGAPIRLEVPPRYTAAGRLAMSQWLDDRHVVLFGYAGGSGTELPDAGDFLTCDITTGACELTLRGEPSVGYQVPGLD